MRTNNKNFNAKTGKTNQLQGRGIIKKTILGLVGVAFLGGAVYLSYNLAEKEIAKRTEKKPTPVEIIVNGIQNNRAIEEENVVAEETIEVSTNEVMEHYRNLEETKVEEQKVEALITTTTTTIDEDGQKAITISFKNIAGDKEKVETAINEEVKEDEDKETVKAEERQELVEVKAEEKSDNEVVDYFRKNTQKKTSNNVEDNTISEEEQKVVEKRIAWVTEGSNTYVVINPTDGGEAIRITPEAQQFAKNAGIAQDNQFLFMQKTVNALSAENLKDKNISTALKTVSSALVANWDNLTPAEQELLAMPETTVRIDEQKASTFIAGIDAINQNDTLYTTGMLGLLITDKYDNRDVAYITLKGSLGYTSNPLAEQKVGFAGVGAGVSFRIGDIGVATIEGSYNPITGPQGKVGVRIALGGVESGSIKNTIPLQEVSYAPQMKINTKDITPTPNPNPNNPHVEDDDEITYASDLPGFVAGQQNDNVNLGANSQNNQNLDNGNTGNVAGGNGNILDGNGNTTGGDIVNNGATIVPTPTTTPSNSDTGFTKQNKDNRTLGL